MILSELKRNPQNSFEPVCIVDNEQPLLLAGGGEIVLGVNDLVHLVDKAEEEDEKGAEDGGQHIGPDPHRQVQEKGGDDEGSVSHHAGRADVEVLDNVGVLPHLVVDAKEQKHRGAADEVEKKGGQKLLLIAFEGEGAVENGVGKVVGRPPEDQVKGEEHIPLGLEQGVV